jgi:hypothetical protein
MTTKAEILAEVASKAQFGWYKVTPGNLNIAGEDGKTISEYTVNYAELVNGTMTKRNLGFYVYQEGLFSDGTNQVDADGNPVLDGEGNPIPLLPADAEQAQWREVPKQKDTARDAVMTFLLGMPNVVRVRLDQLDEEELYGFATVWRTIDASTAEEIRVFVWKDEGQPIAARELV